MKYTLFYDSGWGDGEFIDKFNDLNKAIKSAIEFAKPYIKDLKNLNPRTAIFIQGPDISNPKYDISYMLIDNNMVNDDLAKYIEKKKNMYYTIYLDGDIVKSPYNTLEEKEVKTNKISLKEGQKVLDTEGNTHIIEKGYILQEGVGMTVGEFCSEMEEIYNSYFPNSLSYAKIWKSLGTNILFRGYLALDKKEVSGGIWQNDLFDCQILIQDLDNITEDSPMPELLKIDGTKFSITTKPDKPYMAYGRQFVAFRKFSGSPEKFLVTFEKTIKNLYDLFLSLLDDNLIPENFFELMDIKRKI